MAAKIIRVPSSDQAGTQLLASDRGHHNRTDLLIKALDIGRHAGICKCQVHDLAAPGVNQRKDCRVISQLQGTFPEVAIGIPLKQ